MKKLNYLLLGAVGLLMASCANDDLQAPSDGTYQITVSLPADMATRAIGDVVTGQTLSYTLFQVNGDGSTSVVENKAGIALNNNQATLNLPLVKGYSYKIAFFSQSTSSASVYTYEEGNVSVTYKNMTYGEGINADAYDCFSGSLDLGEVGGAISKSITLNRPVAQINWGTSDLEASSVTSVFGENIQTSLSMSAFTSLDILTGTLDDTETVTFPATGLPSTTEDFPVDGYSYLAMQYVLAQNSGQSGTYDLTLTVSNSKDTSVQPVEVKVNNAPLQANYRTNIYGTLLTDQANITVSLSSDWGGTDHNYSIWDGQTTSQPQKNAAGAYIINNPGEWVWLTKNDTGNGGIGRVWNTDIILNADLDFAGYDVQGMYYSGTLNGQGHTIKNLTIYPKSSYSTGFFGGDVSGGNITVENLNFDNVNLTDHVQKYGWVGVIIGDIQNCDVTLNNVNVNNANLSGVNSIGGLVGFVASNRTLTVNGCSVTNSNLSNIPVVDESGNVAGMVGRVVGTANFGEGNKVENVNIDAYWTTYRGKASIAEVAANNKGSGNITGLDGVTTTNVNITATEVITGASVNGQSYSSLDAAIAANPSGATIQLGVGDYSTPDNFGTGDYILKGFGAEYTIVEANNPTWTGTGTITASDLTFKSFINSSNHTHMAFSGVTNQTFTNVTFNGEFHVTSGNATFTDCTFNYDKASGTNYQLWCQTSGTVDVTNCTMNCNDGKAILVYGASADATGGNVNVDGLTVTSIGNYNDKGVVEIHSENYIKAQTITIKNVNYPASYFKSGLWREINNNSKSPNYENPTHYYTIYVNGVEEQVGNETGPQPTGN